MTTAQLWAPPDVDDAHRLWKANCGPCAVAALIGRTVGSVRHAFPSFPQKAWANPTCVRAALRTLGVEHQVVKLGQWEFPAVGLAFIQFEGPWLEPGVPIGAAYRNTHWVACRGDLVYDVNDGQWLSRGAWEWFVVPHLLEHVKRSTGWHVRTHIVTPAL